MDRWLVRLTSQTLSVGQCCAVWSRDVIRSGEPCQRSASTAGVTVILAHLVVHQLCRRRVIAAADAGGVAACIAIVCVWK